MSFWVYIIYSESIDSYYKGQTDDLSERIRRHYQLLFNSSPFDEDAVPEIEPFL